MTKPKIFIGSSTNALDVARNVKAHLDDIAEVMIWHDLPGARTHGKTIIELILSVVDDYDFAVMIFAPDDEQRRGNDRIFVPRDNVVFELGLFMNSLTRNRTFIIRETSVKILTDLTGVITGVYEHSSESLRGALNTACLEIREAIKELGPQAKGENLDDTKPNVTLQDLLDIREKTGIENIVENIHTQILTFSNWVNSAKKVRILQTWTPDIIRPIQSNLRNCVTQNNGIVEVLLIAPGSIATQRSVDQEHTSDIDDLSNEGLEKHAKRSRREIESTLTYLDEVKNYLGQDVRDHIRVKLYTHLPSLAVYMCDDQAFVGFYPKAKRASEGIFFQVKGENSWTWKALNEEFEKVWRRAKSPESYFPDLWAKK